MDDQTNFDNVVVLKAGMGWGQFPVCTVKRMVEVDGLVEALQLPQRKWMALNDEQEVYASENFADIMDTIEDGLR